MPSFLKNIVILKNRLRYGGVVVLMMVGVVVLVMVGVMIGVVIVGVVVLVMVGVGWWYW